MKLLWQSTYPGIPTEHPWNTSFSDDGRRGCLDGVVWDLCSRTMLLSQRNSTRGSIAPDGATAAVAHGYPPAHISLYQIDDWVQTPPTGQVDAPALEIQQSSPSAPDVTVHGPPSGSITDTTLTYQILASPGPGRTLDHLQSTSGPPGNLKERFRKPIRENHLDTTTRLGSFCRDDEGLYEARFRVVDDHGDSTTATLFYYLRPFQSWRFHEDVEYEEVFRRRRWVRPIQHAPHAHCDTLHMGDVVLCTDGHTVLVLNVDTGNLERELPAHPRPVTTLVADRSKGLVFTACLAKLRTWSFPDFELLSECDTSGVALAVEPRPGGHRLVSWQRDVARTVPDLVPCELDDHTFIPADQGVAARIRHPPGSSTLEVQTAGNQTRVFSLPPEVDRTAALGARLAGETLWLPVRKTMVGQSLTDSSVPIHHPRFIEWRGHELLCVYDRCLMLHDLDDPQRTITYDGRHHSNRHRAAFTDRYIVAHTYDRFVRIDRQDGTCTRLPDLEAEILGADPTRPLVWVCSGDRAALLDPETGGVTTTDVPVTPSVYRATVWQGVGGVQVRDHLILPDGAVEMVGRRPSTFDVSVQVHADGSMEAAVGATVHRVEKAHVAHPGNGARFKSVKPIAWDTLNPRYRFATAGKDRRICLWDATPE